jgi:DNA-binding transcriptional regulator YdaS (Cro superfamily)
MKLRSYLDSLPRGGVAVFAHQIGVSPVYLSQLAAGQAGRTPSPALCVVIERESDGVVRRQDTRPDDWRDIWPELRDAEAVAQPGAL